MKRLIPFAVVLAAFAPQDPEAGAQINVISLDQFARTVQRIAGIRVMWPEGEGIGHATVAYPGDTITDPGEILEVMHAMCAQCGFAAVPVGEAEDRIYVLRRRSALRDLAVPVLGADREIPATWAIFAKVLHPTALPPRDAAALVEGWVGDGLQGYVAADEASGSVYVVDTGHNLRRIAALLQEADERTRARAEAPAEAMDVRVVALEHREAADLAAVLNQTPLGVRAVPDPGTGSLLLGGPSAAVERAAALARQLDRAPRDQ